MDDSVVCLSENSEAAPILSPSGSKGPAEDDDFIVPLPEDDSVQRQPSPVPVQIVRKGHSRTRTRRSSDKDAEKSAAAERKAELKALKLAQKQERQETVERRKAERLEKRRAKEAERLLKKQHREATRARQPKSVARSIMIIVDTRLKKLGNLDAFELRARENLLDPSEPLTLEFVDAEIPYSVTWKLPAVPEDEDEDEVSFSDETLVVLPIVEFINLVHGWLIGDESSNLRSYFDTSKRKSRKKLILILVGLDCYLLNYKTLKNRQHRQQCGDDDQANKNLTKGLKTLDGLKSIVNPDDIERALVDLQMTVGVSHMMAADLLEFSVLVQHFTKALAEKPEKMRKKSVQDSIGWQEFGSSKCVKIGDDGSGRLELWTRVVLQSFSRQDSSFAQAVVQNYTNPRELLEAYRRCDNVDLARNLLSQVDDGGRRRYDASRRVHMMFTCGDPNAVIDKDK